MTPGRNLSTASLAVVTLLGIAFAAWSGSTGPNVAGQQLVTAGENLAAASSVMETADATESVTGTPEVITVHETRLRNFPDRVRISESVHVTGVGDPISYTRTLTQIGDSCWTTVSSPRMFEPLSCEAQTLKVRILDAESGITESGGIYSLSPEVALEYLRGSVANPVGMASLELRITGEYVSWEHLRFDESVDNATVIVDQTTRFTDFDDANRIARPAGPPTANALAGTAG